MVVISYINNMALRVPVVRPHVHVQQNLLVETGGKRCKCVLKAPCFLCINRNKLALNINTLSGCKELLNVAGCKNRAASLPLLHIYLASLCVQMQLCVVNSV